MSDASITPAVMLHRHQFSGRPHRGVGHLSGSPWRRGALLVRGRSSLRLCWGGVLRRTLRIISIVVASPKLADCGLHDSLESSEGGGEWIFFIVIPCPSDAIKDGSEVPH